MQAPFRSCVQPSRLLTSGATRTFHSQPCDQISRQTWTRNEHHLLECLQPEQQVLSLDWASSVHAMPSDFFANVFHCPGGASINKPSIILFFTSIFLLFFGYIFDDFFKLNNCKTCSHIMSYRKRSVFMTLANIFV